MSAMRITRLAMIAAIAVFSIGADKPHPDWTTHVTVTDKGSHILGDPEADVRLTEFISYTCSHCADFHKQSEAPLKIGYVHSGKVSVEIRHMLRDPIDLTVAMLTNCGDPKRFFLNHSMFLHRQDSWLKALNTASEVQKHRWVSGTRVARMQAIANDFGFYRIMEQRGYDRPTVNRCLADEAMAKRLTAQTQAASNAGVEGTPSFMLDGILLTGTHDWQSLNLQLQARM
ncbi:MAG: thioredoxin domain-containing protein [Novosphingobium sp.]|nr:thioredoxin domain-containing protein [Novosphingobium sp.]MCP5404497.1 thioredoxin domain-containing protein [Novosphingobium sp.]